MSQKILVVDNNPVILRLMEHFLVKSGYQVKTAVDGLDAIKILKSFHPEIIFVDLIMPNIPGEKLCKLLRRMPELKHVIIIILSAAAVEQKIDFRSFGADACIAKGPFKEVEKHINFVFQQIENGDLTRINSEIIGTENVFERIVTSELLADRKHFEITLQNMTEGFVELSANHQIVNINRSAARLFCHSEEELLASNFTDLFSGSQKNRLTNTLLKLTSQPLTIGEPSPFLYNDKYLAMTIAGINEEDGVIIIIQDITARKKAEIELRNYQENLETMIMQRTTELLVKNRELEDEVIERKRISDEKNILEQELSQAHKLEAIGTMATGIAHDFNNLLTAILGYTELLRLEMDESPQIISHLANITKAGYRAKELIGLIKTFSQPGGQDFIKVCLPMLIGETLTLLRPSIPGNIQIITDIIPQCPDVLADAVQLQQVILNLANNAIHAMQQSGGILTITLTHEQNGTSPTDIRGFIKLTFNDTGIGIPPDNLQKIFDPYFTTKVGGEGTGLGLSVVQGIISHHNGEISAESINGQGTTFTVILPVCND